MGIQVLQKDAAFNICLALYCLQKHQMEHKDALQNMTHETVSNISK